MATNQDKAQPSGDPHKITNVGKTIYRVVVNHEEQYSIWPVDRKLPVGWREEGKRGTQDECQAYMKRKR